ncbi:MAG: hypothetical protein PHT33_03165 [bacterium]|nr:hypothetical protein [bacterium]
MRLNNLVLLLLCMVVFSVLLLQPIYGFIIGYLRVSSETFASRMSLFVVFASAIILWFQLKENHHWNKLKLTHDVALLFYKEKFDSIHTEEEQQMSHKENTDDKLNWLEYFCSLIYFHVIDEKLAYSLFGHTLSKTWDITRRYRATVLMDDAYDCWVYIDKVGLRWYKRRKYDERVRAMKEHLADVAAKTKEYLIKLS